ncbi:hypothetical protein A3D77_02615 [Candidatus Gottesmanbacteria bacterium RIFCSPHIGHO2_02_FULL_39_11]|uniref:Probable cytosol aminopeptidase n=1 Tax=Candidatus Gottesmanbacteria bacterium RIFCSPHIGHO2_02_FULL_39_11 TaxID=1798382 RepID=A0A1F5ZTB2_9BACT|nr:MAG: hypothetical protein A3D77_02615 [Candidatus Gottesmanbacteria bacterium RIFCSPHIGHO2_02_FULL_39_11]
MKITLKPTSPNKISSDVVIVFSFQGEEVSAITDKSLLELIKKSMQREHFEGKEGEKITISPGSLAGAYKILIVGLGDSNKFESEEIRNSMGKALSFAKSLSPQTVSILPPESWMKKMDLEYLLSTLTEAVHLSSYTFNKYKSEDPKKKKDIEEISFLISPGKLSMAEKGITEGTIHARATQFTRDLVNEPPDLTTPAYLAKVAKDIADKSEGTIKATIYDQVEIEKIGMNAFLGVAKGSSEPPKFIHLSYRPKKSKKKVVLIGKGITFDTGGLSLKPAQSMETMKLDMAGAAAVLGVFKALKDVSPDVSVVGLIAACENMPSGSAMRPGDILKAMSGKTIEVLNTDAEGRLTLADGLSYAVLKEKPDVIIDLATLTGACIVALGEDITGLFSNNPALAQSIEKASRETGEKLWQLPLPKIYKELIKSHIADIKNIQTGKYGGAITAALFLEEFVGNIPWAHLDIAGPSYAEKPSSLTPIGGTGYGVRLLLKYLKNI